jgi:TM2 domain-containing membrane protein YozV
MNNAVKGALLSGLIWPGLGQMVLKRYGRGAVIMLGTTVSLAAFVIKAVQYALAILERIESQGGAIDVDTITNAVSQASGWSGGPVMNLLLLSMCVWWLIGAVDAYRLGRAKDLAQHSATQPLHLH